MALDLEKIADNLVASFIGGWWTWVTFGFLKMKRDLDAAHRKLRSNENVVANPTTSLGSDRHPDSSATDK
jgi:hypothetical protein